MRLQTVPPSAGLRWIGCGAKAFARQPLALMGLFLLFMTLVSLLSVIPVVGHIIALALVPAATLGLVHASRMAAQGRFPMPGVLATGLSGSPARRQAMLVLGASYVGGLALVLGASALADGGRFASGYLGMGQGLSMQTLQEPEVQTAAWIALLAYIPFSALFWHAPMLVADHGIPPAKSLFFSLMACWRNKGAFALYLLGWMGVFTGVALTLGLVLSAIAGPQLGGLVLLPLAMVLAAMFFASIRCTFDDCFLPDAPTPLPPAVG